MNKRCECGDTKSLALRTVIFARKVSITRVPVYCCSQCGSHEVFSGVKGDISRLIRELGAKPAPRTIPFDQVHEWAGILTAAASEGDSLHKTAVERAAEERTNELLDLWLIASSVGDENWKAELQSRLAQLNAAYIS
ncbi:hypothetical protein E5161_05180 [Cohnella pontilimi]|uniref:YgiT-type zinc finger protein n=1 Tax=Cohnella pontilimi TaxID=2564100 RepID=A0A4U0FEP4_9BACL|nr:hypothetical protein [Cohnella pontilimi]TJY43291.1 hypothetical protein E5161_05180 [Cohnella pontilimi]